MKILNLILEDITMKDGKVDFKYEAGSKSNTKFGKSGLVKKTNSIKIEPFKMKIDEWTDINSIYNKLDLDVIKILKNKKDSIENGYMTESDYNHFVKRTANFINHVSKYSKESAFIVTPETTALLLKDIVDELNNKTTYDAEVSFDGFTKNDVKDIKVDYDLIKSSVKESQQQDIINLMEGYLKQFQKQGYFKIKEIKQPQYRKFLTNLFTIKDESLIEKIKGKKIILIDDVLTSGTTLRSVYSILTTLTKPENIQIFTIFKRK